MTDRLIGIAGIMAILAIAVLFSSNRRAIRLRVVAAAFALQAGLAVIVLYTPWGIRAIAGMSRGVSNLLSYAGEGTRFIFGPLAAPEVGGNSFALAALTVIIFFASLISVLYYLGIMQLIIKWVGGAIRLVTGVTRVESLCAAANIFVGQSESPLTIRPYLASLTPAQLFTVMSVGMAGVAGTILAAYAALLGEQALPFLLAASFMAAPGGLLMAKIIMPDEKAPPPAEADEEVQAIAAATPEPEEEERATNIIMAAFNGAQDGVQLAVAVGAMLIVFVALIAMANGILGGIGGWFGHPELSFQQILGDVFAPVMFMLNVPWEEARKAGELFGEKLILNEFV
ncbi:MAG: NupC/NupG family nucleoside CNT transporter, partial [Allosphingosinicella sp.]